MASERVGQPRANTTAAAALERAVRDAHARNVPRGQLEQLVATSTSLDEPGRHQLHALIGELHGEKPQPAASVPGGVTEFESNSKPPPIRHPKLGKPVRMYRYVDQAGELVFVVCRFEPGEDGAAKTFRQARLEDGKWVWNLTGIERPLYRLPRVREALAKNERIWIAEGEKDVAALEGAGVTATCNPMGAGPGKFTEGMAEQLAGARYVTIVVDHDDEDKRDTPENRIAKDQSPKGADNLTPGERHALAIRMLLGKIAGVHSVDVDLVQAKTGKDAHDHLEAGHTTDEFVTWHALAPPEPPPPPDIVSGHVSGDGRAFRLTDLGNSERLVDEHGPDLRYVPQIGWHVWDGHRWQPDGDGEAQRRAKLVSRSIAKDAFDRGLEGDERKHQLAWAFKSEARSRLEAMVALAETDATCVVRVDELDRDHYTLNVRNGSLDLADGELKDHDRTDHITKLADVDYDPAADAPTWRRFLETTFNGDHDLIAFVQRAVGYSLTGSTSEQVLFLLHGRGANGKSTFIETVRAMLGDYAQQAPTDLLMQSRTNRGGATPDLARLPGARFVAAVETGEGRRLDEPLVKQLTGGDRIAARRLYRDVFEFTPTHKLWLATNHLPQIAGTDDAIWRRIRLIPFAVTVPENARDPQLPAKLRAELAGILTWAVDGCSAYLLEGLGEPDAVKAATKTYRDDMDELGAFLEECTQIGDTIEASVKASVLFTRYGYWAQSAGATPVTATAFGRALTERGMQKAKRNDGWHYLGLELTGGQSELN